MDLNSGVSLGQLVLALGVILVTSGIAWGSLVQRIKTLEKEVEALSGFATTLAVMKEQIAHIKEGVNQLTSSWVIKEPPPYDTLRRPK